VDSSNVFEFLRLAANDSSNKETQHEAYWMIIYIFMKRNVGIDISPSFSSQKCKNMLKGINLLEYTFNDGKLVYRNIISKETKEVSTIHISFEYNLFFSRSSSSCSCRHLRKSKQTSCRLSC